MKNFGNIQKIDKNVWCRYVSKNKLQEYYHYRLNQLYNAVLKKKYRPVTKKYASKKVLSFAETNRFIGQAILSGEPFWAGRYGGMEMRLMVQAVNQKMNLSHEIEQAFKGLCINAGFFPNKVVYAEAYTEYMLECSKSIDLHGAWLYPINIPMEEYFIRNFEPDVSITRLGALEPWNNYMYQEKNVTYWTKALKGKKVLVIHPFVETIEKQYREHRQDIFSKIAPADEILPEFELKTLRAVQTIAGEKDERFETWFEALAWMVEQARNIDFDVAIIGCGAYGFPLACEIKEMGKQAIHLGGATQLMFGIMGKRWMESGFQGFRDTVVNEYWVFPSEQEKPKNHGQVENGCYW